jgi:hypothetical protein
VQKGVVGGVIEIIFKQSCNSFQDNKKSSQTLNLRGYARGLRDLNSRARFQTYSLSSERYFHAFAMLSNKMGVAEA